MTLSSTTSKASATVLTSCAVASIAERICASSSELSCDALVSCRWLNTTIASERPNKSP
jgi:hypothetical protein